MANRKLAAAQAEGESLGHMSAEARTELADGMQKLVVSDERADLMFGDGREYSLDRVIEHIDIHGAILEDATLQLGRYFCWMKEREGHGNFEAAIETRTRFSVRSAQVFMGLARELLDENGNPIPLIQYVQRRGGKLSKSKMIELAHMQPEALAKLGAGEEVAGLTRDDVATMSVSELRATVRAQREEKTADQKLLDDVYESKNKIQRELDKANRGGKEALDQTFRESLAQHRAGLEQNLDACEAQLGNINGLLVTLDEVDVPPHADGIDKRNAVMNSYTRLRQLGETLARLIAGTEDTFGRYIEDARSLLPPSVEAGE